MWRPGSPELRFSNHRIDDAPGAIHSSIDISMPGAVPRRVTMRLHDADSTWIDSSATPFLPIASLLGARLGCTVRFADSVDPTALAGARSTQSVAQEAFGWEASSIRARSVARPADERPNGLFFSRGVDSFSSLIAYREEIGILLGLDWVDPPFASAGQDDIWVATTAAAAEIGLPLLRFTTDLRDVMDPLMSWDYSHGAVLAGLGLLAGGRIGAAWISSAYREDLVRPDSGIRADLLEAWSSAQVRIVRVSGAPSRNAKAALVAQDEIASRWLQVCWESGREGNCGRCFKCLHTMSNFATSGSLSAVQGCFGSTLTASAVRALDVSNANPSLLLTIIELLDELPDGDVRDAWSEVLARRHPGAEARLAAPRPPRA